jgi:hypothetical protein
MLFIKFFSCGSRVDEIERAVGWRNRNAWRVAPTVEDGCEVDAIDEFVGVNVGGGFIACSRRRDYFPNRSAGR